MKKTKVLLTVAVFFLIVIGCTPALQIGASFAGKALGENLKKEYSNNNVSFSTPDLVTVAETGRYNVGKYLIIVSDGLYGKDPCVIFETQDQNGRIKLMFFERKNPKYLKMLNDFNRLDETEKKRKIREWFVKYANFDLGPEEIPQTAVSAPPTPSSPPDFPVPAFAPGAGLPR
ncbi:MAG: hypothetical protein Q8O93_02975 [bacterium]|nr:hypothetical protein [bacterium]